MAFGEAYLAFWDREAREESLRTALRICDGWEIDHATHGRAPQVDGALGWVQYNAADADAAPDRTAPMYLATYDELAQAREGRRYQREATAFAYGYAIGRCWERPTPRDVPTGQRTGALVCAGRDNGTVDAVAEVLRSEEV